MGFQTMKSLLPQRLRQQGIERPIMAAQTLDTANLVLDDLFGAQTSQTRAQAVSVKFKQLSIASLDAAFRHELKLRERELVAAINQRLGGPAIEGLKLLV